VGSKEYFCARGEAVTASCHGVLRVSATDDQELSKEVRAFVESYMRVFDTFDSVRIAAFYHIPRETVRADGSVHYLSNEEELRSFFQKVVDTYQQEGCRRFRFRDLEVIAIGAECARELGLGDATRGWNAGPSLAALLQPPAQRHGVESSDLDHSPRLVSRISRH
jgi:hypothetical protein